MGTKRRVMAKRYRDAQVSVKTLCEKPQNICHSRAAIQHEPSSDHHSTRFRVGVRDQVGPVGTGAANTRPDVM